MLGITSTEIAFSDHFAVRSEGSVVLAPLNPDLEKIIILF